MESNHNIKRQNIWQISTVVLGLLLIVSIFMGGVNNGKTTEMTGQAVADKTIKFINQNLLQGQGTASLKGVEDAGNLYILKLSVNGQELNSYVTKDGKLLFPQVVNLSDDAKVSPQAEEPQAQGIPKTETPDVKLFTMSFCPYGNQAEDGMRPVAELLKNDVAVEPHYVIYSNYQGGGPEYCLDKENKYCSMHGIQELNQDVRELCVYKYQKDKFWDFVMKTNEKCSARNVDSCWEPIAKEQGIDVGKIKSCQTNEAIDMLKKEAELNEKYGVRGSPTLVINGATYNGQRMPEAYKQAICSAFATEPNTCRDALNANAGAASPSASAGGCG